MKRSVFFMITAVISLLLGVMCFVMPEKMAAGFGMTVTTLIIMMIREAGACNLSMGFLNFYVCNDGDSKSMKAVLLFNMAYHALMLTVNIYGITNAVMPTSQIIPVFGAHLLIALGFLYYALRVKITPQAG